METKNLNFAYGKQQVLFDVSVTIPKGKITTILGANGCGKSTLLHLLSRNLKPDSGELLLDGKDVCKIPMKQYARKVAIVHQTHKVPEGITVKQLISYGRTPYQNLCSGSTKEDEEIVVWAMELTDVTTFSHKRLTELSGGQLQRVWIAMALAQKSEYLLLDEPTTYLDIKHQREILKLLKDLNKTLGLTIVMVLHDINQAIQYSDELICMKEGKTLYQGTSQQDISQEIVENMYDIQIDKIVYCGKPYFIFA